uniref:Uncharacterized protein n=1 Tax=Anguilla anguilla TaxID=7936 RepID=A0A0E9XD60_ANGAN
MLSQYCGNTSVHRLRFQNSPFRDTNSGWQHSQEGGLALAGQSTCHVSAPVWWIHHHS